MLEDSISNFSEFEVWEEDSLNFAEFICNSNEI